MSPPLEGKRIESKSEAEALIPHFRLVRVLNQDQNGRRITLLGIIRDEAALFSLERAAFPSDPATVAEFLSTLTNTTNLGANDVYRWYMSNTSAPSHSHTTTSQLVSIPDLKLNLIYPCTEAHIRKYTSQPLRYVTETAEIYREYIKPYVQSTQRTPKRLDWIFNILDGITEQEDVVYRSPDFDSAYNTASSLQQAPAPGFLLLPDLNWDRKTLTSLHLLALPQRRDISSLRDLRKSHIPWLRSMLRQIRLAAAKRGTELALAAATNDRTVGDESITTGESIDTTMEPDQVKCYVHYQPTYYHFHVHVVHVMLEPEGTTQSVGKAIGLESLIAMLEALDGKKAAAAATNNDPGLDSADVTYHVGEQSDLWAKCFKKIKMGEKVTLLD